MLRFHTRGTDEYDTLLRSLERRGEADLERVTPAVRAILDDVRTRGDDALRELTERFDKRSLGAIRLDDAAWRKTAAEAPADVRAMLTEAAERIRQYHLHQREGGFRFVDAAGIELGVRVRPIAAAGVIHAQLHRRAPEQCAGRGFACVHHAGRYLT